MSSSIDKLVDEFKGSHFQEWKTSLINHLKANGAGKAIRQTREEAEALSAQDLENWDEANDRAIGWLLLKCTQTIRKRVEGAIWTYTRTDIITPAVPASGTTPAVPAKTKLVTWDKPASAVQMLLLLEREYGRPGISAVYADFQALEAVKYLLIHTLLKRLINLRCI